MEVKYAGKKLVDGDELNASVTGSKPAIAGLPVEAKTLVMWDETVPWLHWMIRDGIELVPYAPPTPPSGVHLYKIGWLAAKLDAPAELAGWKIPQQPANTVSFYQRAASASGRRRRASQRASKSKKMSRRRSQRPSSRKNASSKVARTLL